ncbi:hypothetical protein [Alkaliphilus peptidifermentans]|uniref:Tim44-like domain-containing protein n=1 Tax=Alkaliphilus peptidifermentans DSM 18978 TaxID=1120976 RepID=A0A1G5FXF3_9FIRM|nr:hypothetical protein [Alkaliphilus peptidifermentans]SCY43946.1 hypothetical protein SAMN03080606_01532 [Alkaliphilus peptidifermentans DSM 18978]
MSTFEVILIIIFLWVIVKSYLIRRKIRRRLRMFFGIGSLSTGLKLQEKQLASTPKSVSSMTKVYLPLIIKDFPEFNLFEFTQRTENMMKSVFNAIENQDIDLVLNASEDLKKQVLTYIRDLKSQNVIERYDDVIIHQTEINKYEKEAGKCIIVFQMAMEYYKYRLKNDTVISGRKDLKIQVKYNVNLVYIQDIGKVKEAGQTTTALGLTCPSCGGPVKGLGKKYCEYCGAGIKEISIHTWFLNMYKEI